MMYFDQDRLNYNLQIDLAANGILLGEKYIRKVYLQGKFCLIQQDSEIGLLLLKCARSRAEAEQKQIKNVSNICLVKILSEKCNHSPNLVYYIWYQRNIVYIYI